MLKHPDPREEEEVIETLELPRKLGLLTIFSASREERNFLKKILVITYFEPTFRPDILGSLKIARS